MCGKAKGADYLTPVRPCAFISHMPRTLADTELARWLRAALDERTWGVRTAARKMTPAQPEIARRTLNRILYEGSYPSDTNRALIAAAFDVAVSEVPAAPGPFPRERQAA